MTTDLNTGPESRPTGLFAPGMQLMGKLQFGGKALLICLMFLLPLAWVSWSYYSSKSNEIDFSAKELKGIAYNREIFPLINLGQQWRRDATSAAASGIAPATLQEVQTKIKAAQEKLAAIDRELGAALGTAKPYADLQKAFTAAQAISVPGRSLDEVFKTHSDHVKAMIALLTAVTDSSNLTLDPDIDSYYLMDAAYFRLPDITESSGKLRAMGLGIMKAGNVSAAQLGTLNALMPIADFQFDNMRDGLGKAFAYNANLGNKIDATQVLDTTKAYFALARASVLEGKDYRLENQAAYLALANKALSEQHALVERTQTELDVLVAARVNALRTGLTTATVVLLVCLLLVGYLFYSFYLVTSSGLTRVNRQLQRIAQGDLSHMPAQPTDRDEPAQVLMSVIAVQTVLAQFRASQAELARQHEAGMLDFQMSTQGLPGEYAAMAESTNQLVQAHIAVKMKLVEVMSAYTAGQLNVAMDRLPGQKARVTQAMDRVQAAMQQAAEAAAFNERIRLSLIVCRCVSRFPTPRPCWCTPRHLPKNCSSCLAAPVLRLTSSMATSSAPCSKTQPAPHVLTTPCGRARPSTWMSVGTNFVCWRDPCWTAKANP
ncbi:MAG: hypothetical protein IPN53_17635 [Comamonadaceae bacterium]|nr:hypothetical protein [Comamonadaceae bacterium]